MSRKTHKRHLHKKVRQALKNGGLKVLGLARGMKTRFGQGLKPRDFKDE